MDLPKPIAAYFEADRTRDADAVAACFATDGVVKDERKRHQGHEAIRRWKAEASTAYTYTVEPHTVGSEGGRAVVTSTVTGTFPGSPVDLRYLFVLKGDSIAELEIVP
jgi:ketosteroid isomerase-like protein